MRFSCGRSAVAKVCGGLVAAPQVKDCGRKPVSQFNRSFLLASFLLVFGSIPQPHDPQNARPQDARSWDADSLEDAHSLGRYCEQRKAFWQQWQQVGGFVSIEYAIVLGADRWRRRGFQQHL